MSTVEELSDRLGIQDLIYRYALAVDSRDWELYRQVFTPDARIDYTDSGGVVGDLETVVQWLAGVLEPFAGLQHFMGNHLVELHGDTAQACTYFISIHTALEEGAETIMKVGGYYADQLARGPEGWRIFERVELGTWMEGPYPQDVDRPPWYAKTQRNLPRLGGS